MLELMPLLKRLVVVLKNYLVVILLEIFTLEILMTLIDSLRTSKTI